jgi:tight adherence protein B
MMPRERLLPLLVFVFTTLLIFGVWLAVEALMARRRRRAMVARMEQLAMDHADPLAPRTTPLFRAEHDRDPAWLRALAGRLPHVRDIRHLLQQADLAWTVETFLVLSAGLALVCGALVRLTGAGGVVGALAAAVVTGALPFLYARWRRSVRLDKFEELFPSALDLLGRAVRAGHPLTAGMLTVAEESPEPIASEFRRAFEEQRFGLPFEDSLAALADRVPLPDVRIFVTALLIHREAGGNLAEMLNNLAGVVRQRFVLARQVRTLTAEGRMSMWILGLMPFVVGAFVAISNPEYVKPLVTHPLGRIMVGGALALQLLGWFLMHRIIDIEF